MKAQDFIQESAVKDLEKDLKSPLSYDAIDHMMTTIAKKHNITPKELHDQFVEKHGEIPDQWAKDQVNEGEETSHVDLLDMIKKFLPIAVKELGLATLPKMKPLPEISGGEHPSFGRYVNGTDTLEFAINNRHPIDILRTLAHELVHHKQREDQRLKPDSGETGSDEENEANARAGIIMRSFDVAYPGYFDQEPISENFHDGKNSGRKGLAKRMGVNCKQPVSKLRKIASNSSGEKQRMAHWCANMKSGKSKG